MRIFLIIGALFIVSCKQNTIVELKPVEGCVVNHEVCEVGVGGGVVKFSISPKGSPILKPLILRLEYFGLDIAAVRVSFIGRNMDMGGLPYTLQKVSSGVFQGTGMLSFCTLDKMLWSADVILDSSSGRIKIPFYFATSSPK